MTKKHLKLTLIPIIILLNFLIISKYTYWLDDSQSFIISKYMTIDDIYFRLGIEGHTIWYYLLLAPFSRLGFSLEIASLISILACIFTAYIVIEKAPFSNIFKIFLILSPLLTGMISVSARHYSIMLLLMISITALYKDRNKKPLLYMILISVLVQMHIFVVGFAFALCLLYLIENIKYIHKLKYLIFPIMSVIALVFQISSQLGNNKSIERIVNWNKSFFESHLVIIGFTAFVYFSFFILMLINKNSIKALCIGIITSFWMIGVCFVSSWITNRFALYIWTYILVYWIYYNERKTNNSNSILKYIKAIILIIILIVSQRYLWNNIHTVSGTKETVEFIVNNIDDKEIVTTDLDATVSLIPWLDNKGYSFIDPLTNTKALYAKWENSNLHLKPDDILNYINEYYTGDKEYIYLLITGNTYEYFKDFILTENIEEIWTEQMNNDYRRKNDKFAIYKYYINREGVY